MNSPVKILLFLVACIAIGLIGGFGIAGATLYNQRAQVPQSHLIKNDDQQATDVQQDEVANLETSSTPMPTPENISLTTTSVDVDPQKPKLYECPTAPKGQVDYWLAPVAPDFSVGTDYVPNHLVLLNDYVSTVSPTICLNASAAVHLESMEAAMHAAKLSVLVSSGYRNANYQSTLRDSSEAVRNSATDPYPSVALPGHSEHQLGMAVDLVSGQGNDPYALSQFGTTLAYVWLVQHSWEYGFIQSYPAGKESITGYIAEPWHYRYVGIANAAAIHSAGTTTYEYLKGLFAQEQVAQKYATIAP